MQEGEEKRAGGWGEAAVRPPGGAFPEDLLKKVGL